jgi:prepilin-type processing-associated H-X9-DG protein
VFFCPVDPFPEVGLAAWKNGEPMVESHYMYRATDAGASEKLSENAHKVIAMAKMRLDRTSITLPGHDNGVPALWGDGSVAFLKATFKQVNFNPIYIDTPFVWADTQR